MKKTGLKITAALAALTLSSPVLAYDTVKVSDASQIKFAIANDKVYFRNLDQFDSSWSGCCYQYWMDLTTETGKTQYAYFLLRYASGESIDLLVSDKTQIGAISHMGNFL